MNWKLTLLELLLAGFFAVACIRAGGMLSLERKKNFQRFLSALKPHRTIAPFPLAVVLHGLDHAAFCACRNQLPFGDRDHGAPDVRDLSWLFRCGGWRRAGR